MPVAFAHVNLIARDWRSLMDFYRNVFDCEPLMPERDMQGVWLDGAVNLEGARIRGLHLRLPGYGEHGPTIELFRYDDMPELQTSTTANTPGFSHIAFAVDDVGQTAEKVLENGGTKLGELTEREIPGAGKIIFQYLRDPEGNIIEIQRWCDRT